MRDHLSRESERPDPLDAMLQDSYARAFRVVALAALLAFALLIGVVLAVLR